MRRILVPVAGYLAAAGIYLWSSGAPMRVHLLSPAVLAVGLLLPALLAARTRSGLQRRAVATACALLAMLAWDGASHRVMSKLEPFFILRNNASMYLVAIAALAFASMCLAWLAAPDDAGCDRDDAVDDATCEESR